LLCQDKPETNGPFIASRKSWVKASLDNPDIRITRRSLEEAEVTMEHDEEDVLSAPEEEFVELAVWQDEQAKQMKLGPDDPRPTPQEAGCRTKMKRFRGKWITGVQVQTGTAGHYKVRKRDATRVRKTKSA
jgi:hypothetical protein